jgi:hypothetical protein
MNFIRKNDMFATKVDINFAGSAKQGTRFGGLVSFAIQILFVVQLSLLIQKVVMYQDPTVSQLQIGNSEEQLTRNFTTDEIMFDFGF